MPCNLSYEKICQTVVLEEEMKRMCNLRDKEAMEYLVSNTRCLRSEGSVMNKCWFWKELLHLLDTAKRFSFQLQVFVMHLSIVSGPGHSGGDCAGNLSGIVDMALAAEHC